MTETELLQRFVLDYELQRWAAEHSANTRQDVRKMRQLFQSQEVALRLSQVRSLANVLAPQGSGDVPQNRLARLHELVALKMQRQGLKDLAPVERFQAPEKARSALFWQYVGSRLIALRSGDDDHPGEVERFWNNLSARYPGLWDVLDPATADSIHLALAETFIHNLVETWEYSEGRQQDEPTH